MFFKTLFRIRDVPVAVIVRPEIEERLFKHHFRGRGKRLAGNFCAFEKCFDLFRRNPPWIASFVSDARQALDEDYEEAGYSFDWGSTVGWAGAAQIERFSNDQIERFRPNRHSYAMRVRKNRTDILAPLTSIVTIVYEIQVERHQVTLLIRSIYPGKDIGEITGNITNRERIVFFDWDHPGEPLR